VEALIVWEDTMAGDAKEALLVLRAQVGDREALDGLLRAVQAPCTATSSA
jgi:hypothetical protein